MTAAEHQLADYRRRRWQLVPAIGKRPIEGWEGFLIGQTMTDDDWRKLVRHVAEREGNALLITGPSEVCVLDLDTDEMVALCKATLGDDWAEIPKVRTDQGYHLYFQAAPEIIKDRSGPEGSWTLRAEGCVVVPPSIHKSGHKYRWEISPGETLPDPDLVRGLLDVLPGGGSGSTSPGAAERPTLAELQADPPSEGGRNIWLTQVLGHHARRLHPDRSAYDGAARSEAAKLNPPLPVAEVKRTADSVWGMEDRKRARRGADPLPTDMGNAELFAAMHADRWRYVHQDRKWIEWSGDRWREDVTGGVYRAAKDVARERLRRAAEARESEKAAKWAIASQTKSRLEAAVALACSEERIVLRREQLDAEPWLLSCGNGTLDLRTGELRAPDPGDLISLGTDVPFEPDQTPERWLRFLDEVFPDDPETVGYVRRLVGYAMTGVVREQILTVFHGDGRNGKSTLIETAKRALGQPLALTAEFSTFTRSNSERVRNDIARLHRSRLVVATESGDGKKLDEAVVKQLTGGDTVAARFLFKETFEFRPQFKIVLATNSKPRVDGGDEAVWARLRLVPFRENFRGREDPDLDAQLRVELPGILAWAVQGCLEWQRDGLGSSPTIDRGTRDYREDEDTLGTFIEKCCELDPDGRAPAADMWSAYVRFCSDRGEEPRARGVFGKQLLRQPGVRRGGAGGKQYVGLNLSKGELW